MRQKKYQRKYAYLKCIEISQERNRRLCSKRESVVRRSVGLLAEHSTSIVALFFFFNRFDDRIEREKSGRRKKKAPVEGVVVPRVGNTIAATSMFISLRALYVHRNDYISAEIIVSDSKRIYYAASRTNRVTEFLRSTRNSVS